MKTRKPDPTPDQLAALKRFADSHGPQWRAALSDAWLRDASGPDGALLRQVRNQYGPGWLRRFQFPLPPLTAADIAARQASIPRAR